MAKSGVKLQWNNLDKALAKMAIEIKNTDEVMSHLGAMLTNNTMQRFEDEKSPTGEKWKKSQRANFQKGKTLQDSGELRKSISHRVKGKTIQVGTTLEYARIHQFGGVIRPKKSKFLKFKTPNNGYASVKEVTITARPFIGISKDDKDEARHLLSDFIRESFQI